MFYYHALHVTTGETTRADTVKRLRSRLPLHGTWHVWRVFLGDPTQQPIYVGAMTPDQAPAA